MSDTLDTVKNSTLDTSRAKKMAFPPPRGGPPQMPPQLQAQMDAGSGSLKQAMKSRAMRQGGPPGKKDEATESPQEKMREKRLGIP